MARKHRTLPFVITLCLVPLQLHAQPAASSLSSGFRALMEGRVEQATGILEPLRSQQPSEAGVHLLLCRAFYAEEIVDSAISECEGAASAAPGRSDVELWLGRAYGMKAGAVNPLRALPLARKVRDAFESAVRLDPGNLAAASDLGEFYVAAPVLIGGGSARAHELSQRLQASRVPAAVSQSHRILALLAEKDGDHATAESEFRQATSSDVAAAWNAAAWVNLGAFYAQHGQPEKAVDAVRSGLLRDRSRGATLVDAASVLTEADREPELARRLLREYLASPAKSDAAPAFKVHLQLGNLLQKSGDTASAQKEYAAALDLAPNFPPARKAAPAANSSIPGHGTR